MLNGVEFSIVVLAYCPYCQNEQHRWPAAMVLHSGAPRGHKMTLPRELVRHPQDSGKRGKEDRETQWQTGVKRNNERKLNKLKSSLLSCQWP